MSDVRRQDAIRFWQTNRRTGLAYNAAEQVIHPATFVEAVPPCPPEKIKTASQKSGLAPRL